MGSKPGPRPRPTALKMLQGERPDRINTDAPVPAEVPVEPPWDLSDEAQEVWDRQAPDRIEKGLLTCWDVESFALWCETLVLARRKLEDALESAKPGAASPVSDFRAVMRVLDDLGAAFGWTPSDRSQLNVHEATYDPAERHLTSELLS